MKDGKFRSKFSNKKASSKNQFREFLSLRGFFGQKPNEEETKEKEPASFFFLLGRYWRFLGKHRNRLVFLLGLTPILIAFEATLPWSAKIMVDSILPREDFRLLFLACGVLFLIGLFTVTLRFIDSYISRVLMENFIISLKRNLMKHMQLLSLQRLQDLKIGGVVTRLQSDTESMVDLLHNAILTPFRACLMLFVGLTSLFFLSWKVTLVFLGFCLVLIGLSYVLFNILRPFQKKIREDLAVIGAQVAETFGGIQVVRAFGRERWESSSYSTATHLLIRKKLHTNIINMVLSESFRFVYWMIHVSIWGVGGYYYLIGEITIGSLIAFITFIGWIFQPIFMIMHSFSSMQSSVACAERIFELLDEPVAMEDSATAKEITQIEKEVSFEEVGFEYPDGTRSLHPLTFTLPAGKLTALVGPSGAGKTTITTLLMRFYDVTEGRICIDKQDIRDFKLASYRSLMSLVLQDVFLFDGPVSENIAYSAPGSSMEAIKEAAKIAHCDEFISRFDKGYDTIIGERGVKLSGGQKQRIALARAIIAKPQLLILDEATSNLDSESEAFIQDALKKIFKNRTSLVIAHRLSTIMDADNIIVLEEGKKVEEGAHEELLKRKGRYFEMYTKQMEKAQRKEIVLDWEKEEESP